MGWLKIKDILTYTYSTQLHLTIKIDYFYQQFARNLQFYNLWMQPQNQNFYNNFSRNLHLKKIVYII